MRPLVSSELEDFLYRFENFAASQITQIDVISPQAVRVSLNVQDRHRSFDWIGIDLLFEEIAEAKLLEDEKLHLVDMEEGVSIIFENGLFYFMLGDYHTPIGTQNALCHIIAKSLKYQEAEAKL